MSEVAWAFGKKTIAEYVETPDVLTVLKEYGIDFVQGHHIGKPAPPEQAFNEIAHAAFSARRF